MAYIMRVFGVNYSVISCMDSYIVLDRIYVCVTMHVYMITQSDPSLDILSTIELGAAACTLVVETYDSYLPRLCYEPLSITSMDITYSAMTF